MTHPFVEDNFYCRRWIFTAIKGESMYLKYALSKYVYQIRLNQPTIIFSWSKPHNKANSHGTLTNAIKTLRLPYVHGT